MKDGVVCDHLQCDVKGCPYRWQGETKKEAERVPLRYTTSCADFVPEPEGEENGES